MSTSKYDTDKLQNTHSLPWIYLFILSTLRLGTNFVGQNQWVMVEVGLATIPGLVLIVCFQFLNKVWTFDDDLMRHWSDPALWSWMLDLLESHQQSQFYIISRILLTLFVCCWNILEPCMSLSPKHPPPSHRKFELSQARQQWQKLHIYTMFRPYIRPLFISSIVCDILVES